MAEQVSKLMTRKHIPIVGSKALILGLTFKENCPDLRNTRVIDLIQKLESFNCKVDVYDPWVNKDEAYQEYNINPINQPKKGKYDVIILAVAHDEFKKLSAVQIRSFGKVKHLLYDIKYILNADESDARL